jgi:hypothetical protein
VGLFEWIDSLKIPERKSAAVWLKDLEILAVLYKQVFTNKDGTEGEKFLVTNDVTLKGGEYGCVCQTGIFMLNNLMHTVFGNIRQEIGRIVSSASPTLR